MRNACTTMDIKVVNDIISDGGYRLIKRIPYKTTSFSSAYLIWARQADAQRRGVGRVSTSELAADRAARVARARAARAAERRGKELLRLALAAVPGHRAGHLGDLPDRDPGLVRDPQRGAAAVRWSAVFAAYTLIYLIYQAVSLPVNFAGRSFDLAAHKSLVAAWRPRRYPVGRHLPADLRRADRVAAQHLDRRVRAGRRLTRATPTCSCSTTGRATRRWRSPRRSGSPTSAGPEPASTRRPATSTTRSAAPRGEFVVIFDADFRPRADFLAETLPYLDDPAVGIVQTPQFFRVSPMQTWVERAASATLEVFYRAVQVSRDRFGSALCVGSNAVYRRAALEPSGGFTEIPYAEDSHTGLDMRYHGYELRYLPVALAAGICPGTLDAFMRQQYRWCCGATSLIWTRHMWRVEMPLAVPAAVPGRLAVEPHHRAAHADPPADPDHAARLRPRRDPAAQRAAAAAGRDHRHRARTRCGTTPRTARGSGRCRSPSAGPRSSPSGTTRAAR